MALRELLAVFGVEVDTKPLDKAKKDISGFQESIGKLAAGIGAAALIKKAGDFALSLIDMGDEISDAANKAGVGTDALQEFRYAVSQMGGEAGDADTALRFLNKNLGLVADGNDEASKAFAGLGVQLKDSNGNFRDSMDLIPEIADGIAGLGSQGQKTATAMKVFGKAGDRLLPFLNGGSKGVNELFGRFKMLGGGLSKDFIANADRTNDKLKDIGFATRSLGSVILGDLMPGIEKLVDFLIRGVSAFREWAKGVDLGRTALVALSILLGVVAVSTWAAVAPFVVLAAEIAAVVLVVDDLIGTSEGADTVTKRLIDSLFGVGATVSVVQFLKNAWAEVSQTLIGVWAAVSDVFTAFRQLFSGTEAPLAGLGDIIKNSINNSLQFMLIMINSIILAFGAMVEAIGFGAKKLAQFAGKNDWADKAMNIELAGQGVVEGALGRIKTAGQALVNGGPQNAPGTFDVPLPPKQDIKVTNNNKINIPVSGAKDALGTADAVATSLSDKLAEINADAFRSVSVFGGT